MAQAQQKHEDELIEALEADSIAGSMVQAIGQTEPPPPIADLLERGDAEGLIELGAVYRSGAPFVTRDLKKAVECFEAAASLGHAEAEYLVGVMRFSGIGVDKDPNEGATRLRAAAQKGSLRAKVYVANLYE
ncbi:MAG: hypothetical protein K8H88_11300, partial [Sandaracinaceae bacterium]|nr:hypothetical protein [Sandaracinaceae bacterium]